MPAQNYGRKTISSFAGTLEHVGRHVVPGTDFVAPRGERIKIRPKEHAPFPQANANIFPHILEQPVRDNFKGRRTSRKRPALSPVEVQDRVVRFEFMGKALDDALKIIASQRLLAIEGRQPIRQPAAMIRAKKLFAE